MVQRLNLVAIMECSSHRKSGTLTPAGHDGPGTAGGANGRQQ
jgi:hypothetical protein